ncbi:MAG: phosphopentomutase [Minisyncoccia bacterium]
MTQRIIILIIDSVGIGEQPDAHFYNSIGANTLHHAAQSIDGFHVPNLQELGLGNVFGVCDISPVSEPKASYGRMVEVTGGNDTFAGVWEMAGVVFEGRFTSFSPKIPDVLVEKLQKSIGTGTLCNAYISGFKALDEFADEHFASGEPIVYTCDDGVVLVAAHEDILPPDKLRIIGYKMSRFFAGMNVSRIIARPFVGTKGRFVRTENRRDFIVPFTMQGVHLFQRIKEVGVNFTTTEHLTSLIGQNFVTETIPGVKDSSGIMDSVCEFLQRDVSGVSMFVVPDFDMSGHRKEPKTYASDLVAFDQMLGEVLGLTRQQDILVIVADHGCDPVLPIRGHTREYVPLLVLNQNYPGQNLGTRETFADLGQTICDLIGSDPISVGKSFARQILEKE